MALYEMYEKLGDGRRRLVSTFDSSSDQVTMVNDAQPVTMQRAPLRTSQAPVPHQKPVLTLQQALVKHGRCPRCAYVLANCHCAAPLVNTLQAVVERQQALGLR